MINQLNPPFVCVCVCVGGGGGRGGNRIAFEKNLRSLVRRTQIIYIVFGFLQMDRHCFDFNNACMQIQIAFRQYNSQKLSSFNSLEVKLHVCICFFHRDRLL